jgi:GntR family transcriptional regulator/MocR family aminotransferase
MEVQWSRSGVDLLLRLDRKQGLRAGLERALRDSIHDGHLVPGTPLPSSRTLARDLGVARGTVSQAYDQLVAEGYLASQPRSGIRVADQAAPPSSTSPAEPSPFAKLYRPPVPGVDLRPGRPDLSMFPRRQWLAATRQVLQSSPNSAFGQADWAGCGELREALAGYLGRVRGVVTTPDRIIVCAGFSHALRMICHALRTGGATDIGFEDPFEPDYRTVAQQAGLEPVAIPVDTDGLVADELDDQAAVVVTPAHQYPLGVTMTPQRRSQLLGWARNTGGYILEDDYDSEFRYDRQPVGALQGLAPDRVIYTGTVSKTIAPGLRIGWMVVPTDLIQPIQDVTRGDAAHVSIIDQLALARLIDTGGLDRHLRHCRTRYRRRRDRLAAAAHDHLPLARLSGVAAGLHAVLQLPGTNASESGLLAHLAERSITVDGLTQFYRRADESPLGIVIGYAAPPEHGYSDALDRLVDALRHYVADMSEVAGGLPHLPMPVSSGGRTPPTMEYNP